VVFLIEVLAIFFLLATSTHGSSTLPISPLPPIVPPKNNPIMPQKVELGKKLFFDRRLSGDGTTSCARCHDPERSFTDGQEISLSYPTTRNLRNAPTLMNVGYAKYLFWDGRARSLEEQAVFPIMSPFEMNQNLDFVVEEVRIVPEYRDLTQRIFGRDVDIKTITYAIAAFERTLVSKDAPIDLYLKGIKDALSENARKGLDVFLNKGRCVKCHSGPYLSDQKFYALCVPENPKYAHDPKFIMTRRYVAKINGYKNFKDVKEDLGRYFVTKKNVDLKAFKTPTLREVAFTAPYMHNGVFKTLEEVIEFFNRGGGEGNRVLKPLNLTDEEKLNLKIFLVEALSGKKEKMVYPEVP